MNVEVKPGKYILAVSGGVDSMALLDLLAKKPGIELVVAHFNHGIRPESAEDEELVKKAASGYGLMHETGHGKLGNNASEDIARKARYQFLEQVRGRHKAKTIITAHHQDDLIETAFINLLRGTGHKGLAAISANKLVLRPLLSYSKEVIIKYAEKNKLDWNEDSTNTDTVYLRNYLRHSVISGLTSKKRQELVKNLDKVAKIEVKYDTEIAKLSQYINKGNNIDRRKFSLLPSALGGELVACWLRQNNVLNFDKKVVNRINIALRTYKQGSACPATGDIKLIISKLTARFTSTV